MKRPLVPRSGRVGFADDLRFFRAADCSWPRRHGDRPRCGRCIGCDTDATVFRSGARLH